MNSHSFYGKRKQQNIDSDNDDDLSEDNYESDDDISSTVSDLEKDVMAVMLECLRVVIKKEAFAITKETQCVECKQAICLKCFKQTHSKKVNWTFCFHFQGFFLFRYCFFFNFVCN